MTAPMWLENLTAYSLQVLIVVGAGACLPAILRLRLPAARLAWWQALLVVCLALPLIQPWDRPVVRAGPVVPHLSADAPAFRPVPAPPRVRPEQIALAVLAAGAVLRALWLSLGLLRLAVHRRHAVPLSPLPSPVEAAQARTGVRALVSISEDVAGPVTFGVLEPVVLLPPRFLEMPAAVQEAVACHEFLHVRRRDWLFSLCEELASVVFWFHPAIWWLLAQLRLAREQTVDRAVVELTQTREQYLEALLAIAGTKVPLDLAPAPLFLRKRHLVRRVSSLMKEASMSRVHLVGSCVSMAAVVVVAGWFAAGTFRLKGAPVVQAVGPDAPGVTVQSAGATLLHRPALVYPPEARDKGVQGTVVLEVSVNGEGVVSDARVLSGPEELRRAALQSVLQWHYATEGAPGRFQVSIDYRLPGPPAGPGVAGGSAPALPGAIIPPPAISIPPESATREMGVLKRIDVDSLPEPLRERMRARLAPYENRSVTREMITEVRNLASEIDRHIIPVWRSIGENQLALAVILSEGTPMRAGVPASDFPPSGEQRIRVGAGVQARNLIEAPQPIYPPLAKQARIQGTVRLDVLIGTDGSVRAARAFSGHPLLLPAAMEAVRQWKYRPTYLNRKPVEVVTQVDVNFTLPE